MLLPPPPPLAVDVDTDVTPGAVAGRAMNGSVPRLFGRVVTAVPPPPLPPPPVRRRPDDDAVAAAAAAAAACSVSRFIPTPSTSAAVTGSAMRNMCPIPGSVTGSGVIGIPSPATLNISCCCCCVKWNESDDNAYGDCTAAGDDTNSAC